MRLADPPSPLPSGEEFRPALIQAAVLGHLVRTWADRLLSLPDVTGVAVGLSEANGAPALRAEAGEEILDLAAGRGRRRARGRSVAQRERTLLGPDDRPVAILAVDLAFSGDGPGDAVVDVVFEGLAASIESAVAADAYRRQSSRYLAARDDANESSRAFDAAFEEAVVGMALVPLRSEAAGRLCRANDPLRRLTGLSDDQLRAINFVDLLQPEYRRIPESAYRRVLAGRRAPFKADGLLWREDGSTTWVRLIGSPLLDDMGDPVQLLLQVEELSQRRAPELERAEEHDAVTGLLNARAFEAAVAEASDRAHRSNDPAAVFVTRIASWDDLVDRHGDQAAMELRRQMADRLRATLRLDDVMASLSGGEFAFLAQELTQGNAANVGARVGSALSAPYRIDGHDVSLEVVLGAALSGTNVDSTGDLTQRARAAGDRAREQAVQAGTPFRLQIDAGAQTTPDRTATDAPQVYRHRR